jgi:hypothetical protein
MLTWAIDDTATSKATLTVRMRMVMTMAAILAMMTVMARRRWQRHVESEQFCDYT